MRVNWRLDTLAKLETFQFESRFSRRSDQTRSLHKVQVRSEDQKRLKNRLPDRACTVGHLAEFLPKKSRFNF